MAMDINARAARDAVYDFVAAVDISVPTLRGMIASEAKANGDFVSLVILRVGQPWFFASNRTETISGDCPDWEMPITRASDRDGDSLYKLNNEGVANATWIWL